MNKKESKYFNTAIKMDEALITLLEKKDFDYITIKEICEQAGVNRSTFYLHYENIMDLLQETTRYIMDKHFSYYQIDEKNLPYGLENCKQQDLLFISHKYIVPYLTFVRENRRVFKIALKNFHIMRLDDVYARLFQRVFDPLLARFSVPQKNRSYMMRFYLSGITAIVMEWLNGNCHEELEQIADIIMECVMSDRSIHRIADENMHLRSKN